MGKSILAIDTPSENTKRLTFYNPDGTWGLKSGYDIKKVPRELYPALYKLKKYEDTGLQPDQIEQLEELRKAAGQKGE